MQQLLSKVLFGLFSFMAAIILFNIFPIVVCPLMWLLFTVALVGQFFWQRETAIVARVVTTILFLFVAFRIYNGFTTDFTISAPDSMGLKFIILACFYGLGALFMYQKTETLKTRQFFVFLSFLCVPGMAFTGYKLLEEIKYEETSRFADSNPDCIPISNFESRRYLELTKEYYKKFGGSKSGMIYHTTKETIDGHKYTFVLSDGSKDDVPPLLQITMMSDSNVVEKKVMFRYDPIFRYGYLKYQEYLPDEVIVLEKDSALTTFDKFSKLLPEMKSH